MNPAKQEHGSADAHLGEVLSSVGLDVAYHRAEGNTLYHRTEDGEEVAVTDFVGGFGSLVLGHHDPGVVAAARDFLDRRRPVFAQFSRSDDATALAADLDRAVRRQVGGEQPYHAVFANSGAEAVEIAVKHAEFDRGLRAAALTTGVADRVAAARAALADGSATLSPAAAERLGLPGDAAPESFAAAVTSHNTEAAGLPPVFLAAAGGFHGKLVASVQLTHNPAFRGPFGALAAQARFVPPDRPDLVAEVARDERVVLLDAVVEGGAVHVVERDLPRVAGFALEPIQGEGGIREITPEFAAEVHRVCAELGCPVIADEIQTGMGRTGAFLAGPAVGLVGDYVTLAKSLGGGLAKVAATLIRADRYRPEFELVHSSTFAKDGFGTALARQVLARLEADDGAAYRQAARVGAGLRAALDDVAADHPEVVVGVRGRGLMLGLEFRDLPGSSSAPIAELSRAGFLGYAIAGYLLRAHRVRTFPTGSAPNTLRFAPSLHLTDDEVRRLAAGLRDVCRLLHEEDGPALVGAPRRAVAP
ncbi:aspartate aminotransferase family protein [Saccharothrix sp. Mg75]|uniref:aspartate aminotransferase family protein n=1 Tax=Saccharothrix sp. Mg75 TaxID=3445357 RepID=UPI003EEDE746